VPSSFKERKPKIFSNNSEGKSSRTILGLEKKSKTLLLTFMQFGWRSKSVKKIAPHGATDFFLHQSKKRWETCKYFPFFPQQAFLVNQVFEGERGKSQSLK